MRVFLAGTDTDVGKTVVAAWLMLHSTARYWKPVQSGTAGETDEAVVRRLTGLDDSRFHPSTHVLPEPLSPHESARRAGVAIKLKDFTPPEGPLVIEGAGGLMVPLNPRSLVIDLIQKIALPTVLVSRTALGTINHTLLSIEAMRRRGIHIAGIVLNGEDVPHNRKAIEDYGQVRIIAHLPVLSPPGRAALLAVKPDVPLESL